MVIDLLCNAPTSVLIYPPDAESTALGQQPPPTGDSAKVPADGATATQRPHLLYT